MRQYLGPYPNPASRRPCHVLLREITRAGNLLREVEDGLGQLADLPALIIWADRDFAFRKPELARWERIFSDHQTHVLHGARHFFQDDAAPEVAANERCHQVGDFSDGWKPSASSHAACA